MTDVERIVERARDLLDGPKRACKADMIEVLDALIRNWDEYQETKPETAIVPRITNDPVTDEIVRKLRARNEAGWVKYGQPLTPFDNRNTERDIEEELLDALQYVTKMRMERAAIADLLERAAAMIDWFEDFYSGEVAAYIANAGPEVTAEELDQRVASLRADVWRIGDPS